MNIISINNLKKSYSIPALQQKGFWRKWFFPKKELRAALQGIDLSVVEGESIALVGPNGAGKSTLIKILSGILVPTSGCITIKDRIPWKHRYEHTKNIGLVMGQKSLLYWDIPVIESLLLFKDIYQLSPQRFRENLNLLDTIFHVQELLHIPVRKLSLGQRMKCEVLASVIHLPKILFLDEPTIGLDLPTKIALLDYLKELHQKTKTTILLASHYLQEVEFLCDRILILNQGRFIYDGSVSALKSRIPSRTVSFQKTAIRDDPSYQKCVSEYQLVENEHWVEGVIAQEEVTGFLRKIMESAAITDLSITEPPIEMAIRDFLL